MTGDKLTKAMITVASDIPAATVVERYSPDVMVRFKGKKSVISIILDFSL